MRRQLVVVSLLTGLSQLAAFFKLWFTARVFGVGSELDGYNLALVIPTLISGVVAGVLQTGFFPVRASLHAKGDVKETDAFERSVLWGSALLGLGLSFFVMISTPWLRQYMAPEGGSVCEAFSLALPYVSLLVVLNMVCDCSGYMLAMRGKFPYAAGAPIVNGILGGLMLGLWPEGGLLSLVLGTLVGASAQLLVCLWGVRKTAFLIFGSLPSWVDILPRVRKMTVLGSWVLPGVVFSNVAVSLPPVWAASYGEGVVSAFGYAYRLHTSLVQLLIMASSTLILARFSHLIAERDGRGIQRLLRQAAVMAFSGGALCVIFIWFFGEPLLLWLFGGRFNVDAASKVTAFWIWLSVGLGFTLLGNVFAKLWQAQSRPKLISVMAASSLVALCASYFLLRELMGERAVALALSVAPVAVVLWGLKFLDPLPQRKAD